MPKFAAAQIKSSVLASRPSQTFSYARAARRAFLSRRRSRAAFDARD
jgi:hypothetical protein